jgi:hypothetical protein
MSSRSHLIVEAKQFVGKRIGSRVVTGYVKAKIGNDTYNNVYLTALCDCGRRCLVKLANVKQGFGLSGCRSCAGIIIKHGSATGKGITQAEARRRLEAME